MGKHRDAPDLSAPPRAGAPDAACAACGGGNLVPHIQVAEAGASESLIPTTDRFGSALADIARCQDCGHMQLERLPAEAELAEAYADAASEAYIEEEAGQRETARRVLARIERHAGRGTLLDLGCWVGFLLDEARTRGWETLGVEPSEFASTYARDRLGLEVRTADLFEADLGSRTFDAVVMGDVIEHLPRPGDALDRIASLAPGGVLALALPDAGSRVARAMGRRWWSVIPTHVQYFTRGSMRELLRRRGYRPLEVSTSSKAFTVAYYLSRIEGYSRPLGKALVSGAEGLGLAGRMWAPDFRDRMLVIARAPSRAPS